MRIQGLNPFQAAAKDTFRLFVSTADQEILGVFYDMVKIVIQRIAPVADIDSRGTASCAGAAASTIWQKALYSLRLRPGWMTMSVKHLSRME